MITETRIRCGHCRGRHATVAEVRACSTPIQPPPGRYAVELPDKNSNTNKLRFFIVTGKRFVEQAGPNTYPILARNIPPIFRAIMADPYAAMIRYGKELKICGACSLPLTKKISRERGMGEVCWGRYH